MVNEGNYPQMALIQISEILSFTQLNDVDIFQLLQKKQHLGE